VQLILTCPLVDVSFTAPSSVIPVKKNGNENITENNESVNGKSNKNGKCLKTETKRRHKKTEMKWKLKNLK